MNVKKLDLSPAAKLAARLPDIVTVQAWSQSLAALDAIIYRKPLMRQFAYSAMPAEGQVGYWTDGCGNDYSITFTPHGAFARGFFHESLLRDDNFTPPKPWPGLLDGVPKALRSVAENAVYNEFEGGVRATVTLWRLADDPAWNYGRVSYPSDWDLTFADLQGADVFDDLDGRPERYKQDVEKLQKVEVDIDAVRHVFAHRQLTEDIVRALNPAVALADLTVDLHLIGYPNS